LFGRLFPHRHDDEWIEKLDDATLRRFHDLFEFEAVTEERSWGELTDELEDALFQLAAQLRISGCSAAIRSRIKHGRIRELPFFKLTAALQAVVEARKNRDEAALLAGLNHVRGLMEACHQATDEVLGHLEKRGVSTDVVYQLAFLEAALDRLGELLELNFNAELPLSHFGGFVARLVRENRARESVTALLRQNFQLLTRKIVERNAETGEHYIARTPGEYGKMLQSAAGGGVIMAFTTWFKLTILGWHLPELQQGLAASLNYAAGFVGIQLSGATLATKQPANTAPALAHRLEEVRDPAAQEALVDEVVYLIRSQFASIVGNLALVVPTTLALHLAILHITGHPMMRADRAAKMIQSLSIFGPSIIYAGFTGVLLWASSLIAAWADNWFVCHRIGEALTSDRRLVRTLGTSRALRFGRFWSKNIAGLAGNISFGVMLGLIPELAVFAGIPLDIRHVTLSSSMLTAAVASLGPSVLTMAPFWRAVAGIAGIGFMNVTVSFSLAMMVAIRAREIQSPERHAIYRSLLLRLRRQPLSFVLPTGPDGSSKIPEAVIAKLPQKPSGEA
jgi:site-specific recombinase